MDYRYRISQDELERLYLNAQARMNEHQNIAEQYRNEVMKLPYFKSEKEALEEAIRLRNENHWGCQIWADVEKVNGIYRIRNYWLVTDNGKIKLYADYIGMALMYDETRLLEIVDNGIPIDDVVSYF